MSQLIYDMTIQQAIELYRLATETKGDTGILWVNIHKEPVIVELKIEHYVDFICRAVPFAVHKMAEEYNKQSVNKL